MTPKIDIEKAESIVSDYGKFLSSIEPSIYGIAMSRLPHDKEIIKTAIQTLVLVIDKNDEKIQNGLTQAYVYLAQFIDDEKAELAERGRTILENEAPEQKEEDTKNLEIANQAIQTINSIKSDMENLMSEIRLLVT